MVISCIEHFERLKKHLELKFRNNSFLNTILKFFMQLLLIVTTFKSIGFVFFFS